MDSPSCACGCGEIPRPGNKFIHGHNGGKKRVAKPCACGCGEMASARSKFVKGHDKRRPKPDTSCPCACGCGGMASGKTDRGRSGLYISGHNARVAHPFKGKRHTDETRKVIAQKAAEQARRQFPDVAIHNPYNLHPGAHGSWHWMMSRCFDSWNASYPSYGGRGITVCERWLTFDGFFADMGDRPEGLTLERKDGDLGYWCGRCEECVRLGRPANCCWATLEQQNANRRNPWDARRERYGPSGGAKTGGRKARVNECGHPDRPYCSKGMCRSCYRRNYRASRKATAG